MQAIIKYKANDGTEWNNAADAASRDELIEKVDAIMAPLGNVIPEAVERGDGYLQHDPATVTRCKQGILDLCKPDFAESFPAFNEPAAKVHPMSIIGRILSDHGGPLDVAWSRFARIDPAGREVQQPYYAYGAGAGEKTICIEGRSNQ